MEANVTEPRVEVTLEKIRTGETEPYETVRIDAAGNETVTRHDRQDQV